MGFAGVVRLVGVLCAGAPCARAASFSASFANDPSAYTSLLTEAWPCICSGAVEPSVPTLEVRS